MRTATILLLFLFSLNALSQKTYKWNDLEFIQLEETVKTTFGFVPMDSSAVESAKLRSTPFWSTNEISVVQSDSGTYVSYQNTVLLLAQQLNANSSLNYVGYIDQAKVHLINWRQDNTMTNCIVELPSGNALTVSRDFDQGILGIELSRSGEYLLVYSSYDSPDYDHYYDYRSEFRIYRISRSGLKNWVLQADYTSEEWSIADAVWIDSQTIALKTYLGTNYAAISENRYTYFQIKITDDLEDCQPR